MHKAQRTVAQWTLLSSNPYIILLGTIGYFQGTEHYWIWTCYSLSTINYSLNRLQTRCTICTQLWMWTMQFPAMTLVPTKSAILSSPCHFIYFSPTHTRCRCMQRWRYLWREKSICNAKCNYIYEDGWKYNILERRDQILSNVGSCPVVSENSWRFSGWGWGLLVRFWETFWLSPPWFIINEIWPLAARQNYHLTLSLCNNGPKLCCLAGNTIFIIIIVAVNTIDDTIIIIIVTVNLAGNIIIISVVNKLRTKQPQWSSW